MSMRRRIRRLVRKCTDPFVPRLPIQLDQEFPEYEMGRGSYGGSLQVHTYGSSSVLKIGHYCSIAADVEILLGGEHKFEFVSSYPFNVFNTKYSDLETTRSKGDVIIGSDVWIGRGAMILSGVNVGHGAVIAANAVIAKDVPPYAIVAGNPAKVLKYRFGESQVASLLELAWWDWPEEVICDRIPKLMNADVDDFLDEFGAGLKANHPA